MCWLLLFLCIIYDCTSDSRETATKPALSKVSKFHKECRSWFHVMLFITTQRFTQIPKSLIQRGEIGYSFADTDELSYCYRISFVSDY